MPNGFDPDRDFLPDPDYTSRFNGTSAAAPMVSGVIALMLQANPNLTYRDVEEILVRSSRQNAQFEFPSSGVATFATNNTWQTNQIGPYRNPDAYDGMNDHSFIPFDFPIADPNADLFGGGFGFDFFAPDTNDFARQESSTYEPQPALFTNGAGYTVSQGYGIYGEQIGYAHGVVDAEAAVYMALHWDELNQNIAPNTELTYTTAVVGTGLNLPAAEKGAAPPNGAENLVPGGIGGHSGFIAYWNQYFVDMPFDSYTGPSDDSRGASYIDFAVPPSQEMNVEWVEVKIGLGASSHALDGLRIMLTSPDGTQSELNNYYQDPSFIPFRAQPSSDNPTIDPAGDLFNGVDGDFVWTFSTNRNWGESSNSEMITNVLTGEPLLVDGEPVYRNWELHIENWSNTAAVLDDVEIVWHGKPIGGGTYDPNYSENGIISASACKASSASIPTETTNSISIATCRRSLVSMPI